ncbi:MAG: septum formation family protein [Trebonia sp.]
MSPYAAEGTQDAEVPGDPEPATAEGAGAEPPSDAPAQPTASSPAMTEHADAEDATPEGSAPGSSAPEADTGEDDADEDDEPSRADTPDEGDDTDGGYGEDPGYGDAEDYADDWAYGDGDYRDGDYGDGDYGDGDYGDDGPEYEDDYYDSGGPYERPKVSKLAVVALITGIIPLVPIALITGIAALVGIRRSGRRGQGMAVSALFFAVGWLVLAGAVVVIAHYTHDFKKPVKVVYSEASVFKLQEGDCIDTANGQQVTIISCATPHDDEVFGTFALPAGPWPGTSAIEQQAGRGCATRLTAYINPQLAISLSQTYVYPTQGDWAAGTRTVICEVHAASGQLSQSVRGAS